jgi:hypothetical protein
LFRQLDNGKNSLFLDDPWLGEDIVLREQFPCLVRLFPDPGISVGDLYRRGWGAGGASWRRQLFAWEEELLEGCCVLLNNTTLQNNVSDK